VRDHPRLQALDLRRYEAFANHPAGTAATRISAKALDQTIPSALVRVARGSAGIASAQPAFRWRPELWRARVGSLDGIPEQTVRDGLMSRREQLGSPRTQARGGRRLVPS
jgi:hypothetical protein